MLKFEIEDIEIETHGDFNILKLPELSKEEINLIDPLVAPTSGLRIQILDIIEENGSKRYILTRHKLFLFLRVFKAISQVFKEMKKAQNLKILIWGNLLSLKKYLVPIITKCKQNVLFSPRMYS